MGNEASSPTVSKVDGGWTRPQNKLYASSENASPSPFDYDRTLVRGLIVERRIAPFYRSLDEASAGGDDDSRSETSTERTQAPIGSSARERSRRTSVSARLSQVGSKLASFGEHLRNSVQSSRAASSASSNHHNNVVNNINNNVNNANYINDMSGLTVECPICFLTYPCNINYTACCDHPICTECFVQLKRSMDGGDVCCPYCTRQDVAIVYLSPIEMRTLLNPNSNDSSTINDTSKIANDDDVLNNAITELRSKKKSQGLMVTADSLRPYFMDALRKQKARERELQMRRDRQQHYQMHQERLVQLLYGRGDGDESEDDIVPLGLLLRGMVTSSNDLDEMMLNEAIRLSLQESQVQPPQFQETDSEVQEFLTEQQQVINNDLNGERSESNHAENREQTHQTDQAHDVAVPSAIHHHSQNEETSNLTQDEERKLNESPLLPTSMEEATFLSSPSPPPQNE